MMFAIEGPRASRSAPTGTCSSTHSPASRPPGTPPVPARKVDPDDDGCTRDQEIRPRLTTRATATATRSPAVLTTAIRPAGQRTGGTGALTTTMAARTARGTAIGSRYWKPLTAQTSKNRHGTATQATSRCSDHESERRIISRPTTTTATTPNPSAGG